MYSSSGSGDINFVVRDVMDWLRKPDNTKWLLVFDNVDRAYGRHDSDPDAYDIASYLSGADHGSVLVTTRLANFEQLGVSRLLSKVDKDQAQAIFRNWYKRSYGEA
jgi:hypothetical protein